MWSLTLAACHGTAQPDSVSARTTTVSAGIGWVGDPTLQEAGPTAPLSRAFVGATNVPTLLRVRLDDGGTPILFTTTASTTDHVVPLIGFQPSVSTTVTVTPTSGGADGTPFVAEVVAEALPDLWPDIDIDVHEVDDLAPGWTLVGFGRSGDAVAEYAVMLDAWGGVRWIVQAPTDVLDLKVHAPARVSGVRLGEAFVWDLLGNTELAVTHYGNPTSTGLGITPFGVHHDLVPTPDGGWFTLALGQALVDDYPTNYDSALLRAPATIADEHVLRLDPEGAVLADWSLSERLDPTRIGYNGLLDRFGVGLDWGHANGLHFDADADELVVSLRHQDAVIGLDGTSGDLKWILATPDNWNEDLSALRMEGPFDWFFHPHAPEVVGDQLLLFDNGNDRASPFSGTPRMPDELNHSRVVRYAIDPIGGTAEEQWVFEDPLPGRMYSNREGDANRLANGNVLTVWGSVGYIDGATTASQGLGDDVIYLIEVTDDSVPRTVWQVRLSSDPEVWRAGWSANRAVRVENPWLGLATLDGPLP